MANNARRRRGKSACFMSRGALGRDRFMGLVSPWTL
jgi:hypothetical protein